MNQIVHGPEVRAENLRVDGVDWSSLAEMPRWVVWRTVERGGKPTKVPFRPFLPGTEARANDASTWGTKHQAEVFAPMIGGEGVGIELGTLDDEWCLGGIDLDTCRDPATGVIDPWAAEIIRRFKSYSEVSPSGLGVKIMFRYSFSYLETVKRAMGTATGRQFKRVGGEHPPGIEFYITNRYFAFTGQSVPGTPPQVHIAFLDDILHLINVAGPAFVRAGQAETLQTELPEQLSRPSPLPDRPSQTPRPFSHLWERIEQSGVWHTALGKLLTGDFRHLLDGSRSGRAMAMGAALARAGYTFDEMVEALRIWPHTADWAREKGDPGNGREFRRLWDKAVQPATMASEEPSITIDGEVFMLHEDGIARAFSAKFKDQLRYCHHAGSWYRWNATIWEREQTDLAFEWARSHCRNLADEPGVKDRIKTTLAKASTASAIERFARSDRAFAVTSEIWDCDPFLLGTPTGTVDLRLGSLIEPRPEDHLTKTTSVGPSDEADCPLWLAFLQDVTAGDAGLIRFLQQFCGYLLTGDTREHALLFVYGPGGNGKSVFLNTVTGIMLNYATTAAMDSLTASSGDRHPADMAMLRGARVVSASETEEGRPWAEAKIKQLTGGDPVTARFMRQDFFTYLPEFKLVVIGNHKPVLRNVDDAARRRFNVAPFVHKPPSPDLQLETKLRAERPAILRWMIDGCLMWQRDGLVRPQSVIDATAEYFSEQDNILQWIEECCDVGSRNLFDTTAALFKSWSEFAVAAGERPGTARWFAQTIQRHGCDPVKDVPNARGKRGFRGIAVKNVNTADQWQNRESDKNAWE